jgi:hypothetical protein
MLTWIVENETGRTIQVDGLGVFPPDGTEHWFNEGQAEGFRRVRGVPLLQTNVPEGISVTLRHDDIEMSPSAEEEVAN